MQPITEVAARLGLSQEDLVLYGSHKAKVKLSVLDRPRSGPPARLVLVSAITPTPAGEGKTTTSIGLAQALDMLGEKPCLALREPSLGPCFGVKGGGTGGGLCKVEPHVDINLHFNGDFHAITSAHNLVASVIDNHLHFWTKLRIDPRHVVWPRVLDLNDRALRGVTLGLGGPTQGMPRQCSFDITAASEVMAILCLAESREDLRRRLDNVLVAYRPKMGPLYLRDLGITGALMALLKDAIVPNLVQTIEGTPALLHGGPFANIAHGCNSVLATRMASQLADWVITEAGFGFDLGAEKFFDIKCAGAGLNPNAVVLVATVRALKMHGGVGQKDLTTPDPEAVQRGLANLDKHIENVQAFGKPPIICLNRFGTDSDDEIATVRERCAALGLPFAESDHFMRGGEGALELARVVVQHTPVEPSPLKTLYDWSEPIPAKIAKVAATIYGARDVVYTKQAARDLRRLRALGFEDLPVCIAKTQSSLSDDPKLRGRPRDFEITVRGLQVNSGAGFVVVLTGDLLRMPGLPRRPQALDVDLVDGEIVGIG